ncbi:hypothetical protein K488DRAFT_47848 [Vararia minispora EC-137]|uniref:Uncharacterized protein n=1 Tax=Vararia minispora EC-137 TaxID=1314806 RepID=A0ACB8QPN1_9AGAM|nr:hypothetical protein K488DRAFT_47848 [Vararia minispora EC-137]
MSSNTPLDAFFATYPSFAYDPSASATAEFARTCAQFRWGEKRRKKAHRAFSTAMVAQFAATFGTDVGSLRSWQALCEAIDIEEVPDTLTKCKKAVKRSHVNIVDLLDAAMHGERTRGFPSERALSKYTLGTPNKIFPLDRAKAGGLLRYLLRQIIRPSGR